MQTGFASKFDAAGYGNYSKCRNDALKCKKNLREITVLEITTERSVAPTSDSGPVLGSVGHQICKIQFYGALVSLMNLYCPFDQIHLINFRSNRRTEVANAARPTSTTDDHLKNTHRVN